MGTHKKQTGDIWEREAANLRQAWEHAAAIELAGDVRVVVSLYPLARKGIWRMQAQAYVPELYTAPRRAGLVAFEVPRQESHSVLAALSQQLYSLDHLVKGWREQEEKRAGRRPEVPPADSTN